MAIPCVVVDPIKHINVTASRFTYEKPISFDNAGERGFTSIIGEPDDDAHVCFDDETPVQGAETPASYDDTFELAFKIFVKAANKNVRTVINSMYDAVSEAYQATLQYTKYVRPLYDVVVTMKQLVIDYIAMHVEVIRSFWKVLEAIYIDHEWKTRLADWVNTKIVLLTFADYVGWAYVPAWFAVTKQLVPTLAPVHKVGASGWRNAYTTVIYVYLMFQFIATGTFLLKWFYDSGVERKPTVMRNEAKIDNEHVSDLDFDDDLVRSQIDFFKEISEPHTFKEEWEFVGCGTIVKFKTKTKMVTALITVDHVMSKSTHFALATTRPASSNGRSYRTRKIIPESWKKNAKRGGFQDDACITEVKDAEVATASMSGFFSHKPVDMLTMRDDFSDEQCTNIKIPFGFHKDKVGAYVSTGATESSNGLNLAPDLIPHVAYTEGGCSGAAVFTTTRPYKVIGVHKGFERANGKTYNIMYIAQLFHWLCAPTDECERITTGNESKERKRANKFLDSIKGWGRQSETDYTYGTSSDVRDGGRNESYEGDFRAAFKDQKAAVAQSSQNRLGHVTTQWLEENQDVDVPMKPTQKTQTSSSWADQMEEEDTSGTSNLHTTNDRLLNESPLDCPQGSKSQTNPPKVPTTVSQTTSNTENQLKYLKELLNEQSKIIVCLESSTSSRTRSRTSTNSSKEPQTTCSATAQAQKPQDTHGIQSQETTGPCYNNTSPKSSKLSRNASRRLKQQAKEALKHASQTHESGSL